MKRICFIAQFPPPIHGLSKAVETLFCAENKEEFVYEKIDITDNRNFLKNLICISKSRADLFYFTISQTKGGNWRDLIIMKLLRVQHKRCLVHLHGGYYRHLVDYDMGKLQKRMNCKAVRELAGTIVLGNSLRKIFEGMISDEKIFIVPNCVDNEYLMSSEDIQRKVFSVEKKRIKHVLYLSNFIRSKGYPEVLEMAKREKDRVNAGAEVQFHFDFAGKFYEKSEKNNFFKYIEENSLEEYITYHGIVDGDRKRQLLSLCDIFVLLTRYPNEGQPISILEAMGNGMVIVTTNHAGIPDIVKDGINGIVVEKDDELPDLYSIRNFEQIMLENYQTVRLYYTQEQYVKRMEELFRTV